MVMFLFVIAYLGRHADAPWAGGPSWQALGAVAAAGALMVEDRGRRRSEGERTTVRRRPTSAPRSAVRTEIGRVFLSDHLLAFEITSIVLLAAAVGGVVLGSQASDDDPRLLVTRRYKEATRAE